MKYYSIPAEESRNSAVVTRLVPPAFLRIKNLILFGAATDEDELVGILAVYDQDTYFRILHIQVDSRYRRRGIAGDLLSAFLQVIDGRNLVLDVVAQFYDVADSADVRGFFLSRENFLVQTEGRYHMVPAQQRRDANLTLYNQLLQNGKKKIQSLSRYADLTRAAREDYRRKLLQKSNIISNKPRKRMGDISCYKTSGNAIVAAAEFYRTSPDSVELGVLYASSRAHLAEVFAAAMYSFESRYSQMDFTFFSMPDWSRDFMGSLFGDQIQTRDFLVAHWNGLTGPEEEV